MAGFAWVGASYATLLMPHSLWECEDDVGGWGLYQQVLEDWEWCRQERFPWLTRLDWHSDVFPGLGVEAGYSAGRLRFRELTRLGQHTGYVTWAWSTGWIWNG